MISLLTPPPPPPTRTAFYQINLLQYVSSGLKFTTSVLVTPIGGLLTWIYSFTLCAEEVQETREICLNILILTRINEDKISHRKCRWQSCTLPIPFDSLSLMQATPNANFSLVHAKTDDKATGSERDLSRDYYFAHWHDKDLNGIAGKVSNDCTNW